MRIQIIGLVLLAILATSDADRAMAQGRIDISNFSANAEAELSDRAQATETESGEVMVTIAVKGTNWGMGRPEDIKSLLENVAEHLTRHFREGVHATIEVENSPFGPRTLLRIPGQTTYTILLDTSDRNWAQYSYQFAHEFCHVVSNYGQQFGRPNQWIDETICETASLFTLRSMGATWKEKPPYQNWLSFAQNLTACADTRAAEVESKVPDDEAWEEWFRRHEARGRNEPYDREGNLIVALRLLPLFEQYPEGWNTVRSLPASQERISQYLTDWNKQADQGDRAFITRIEAVLGIRNRQSVN